MQLAINSTCRKQHLSRILACFIFISTVFLRSGGRMSSVSMDDIICFSTVYKFDLPATDPDYVKEFITAYDMSACQWRLGISKYDDGKRELYLQDISLRYGDRDRSELVFSKCILELTVSNSNGHVVSSTEHSFTDLPRDNDNIGSIGIIASLPSTSPMGQLIQKIFDDDKSPNKCVISIRLFANKSIFGIAHRDYGQMARPYPAITDFRHAAITDLSQHDFLLITDGGIPYPVSRAALYLGSPKFQKIFNDNPGLTEYKFAQSLAAAKTATIFMVTNSLLPPPKMTPKLLREIMTVAKYSFNVMNLNALSNSLEKLATEELEKENDIDVILEWIEVSSSLSMTKLVNSAYSLILLVHYEKYIKIYAQPPTDLKYGKPRGCGPTSTHRQLQTYMYPQMTCVTTTICEPRK